MNYIRYSIATILGMVGFWILVLNWQVFWNRHIKGKHTPSWIPLLSGFLLCIAFAIIPFNMYRRLCWYNAISIVDVYGRDMEGDF